MPASSVFGPAAVKVVAETEGIHHLVGTGVAGHLAAIRKVEVAGAKTNLPGVRETKLCAHTRLQREIEVGAITRERLLRVCDHATLDSEIGLPHLAVAPEHAKADRRDRETGYRGVVVAQGISVFVFYGGLTQEDEGQNLANVIHACTGEVAPGVPVVLDAGDMEVGPPTA